jgi:HlyD family secretion protein
MTVRELVVDEKGEIVKQEEPAGKGPRPARPGPPPELAPGQKRQEIEGVFMVKDGHAVFVPVKTGIAGEKFFEVLDGLKEGDEVITGPFSSVRALKEGDAVKISTAPAANTTGTPNGN